MKHLFILKFDLKGLYKQKAKVGPVYAIMLLKVGN